MRPTDQAEGLRRMLGGRALRVVRVASGVAAAGRTTLVVNLAIALASLAREVIVIDENNALGNACDAFGLRPRFELAHALSGDRPLAEVLAHGPRGVRVLAAARGMPMLEGGQVVAPAREALDRLLRGVDYLLVDCARGRLVPRPQLFPGREELIVPAAADARSITGTYAWIKQAAARDGDFEARLVISRAASASEARSIHANLASVARRHLGLELELLGAVRGDARVAESARRGEPLCAAFPRAEAARDFRAIACRLESGSVGDARRRVAPGDRLAA